MALKNDDRQKQLLEHFLLVENCLIAEIHRLAHKMPPDFIDPKNSRYESLLVDFAYFENRSKFDYQVETVDDYRVLDEEFYSKFDPFLTAFYKLIDEICVFIHELTDYAEKCHLNQNPLDKRYLKLNSYKSEVVHLLGVILLLVNEKFPGSAKERIFVAVFRSKASVNTKNFELIVSLLRNRRENFETCLSSIKMSSRFVEHVIGFLKDYSIAQQVDGSQDSFLDDAQAAMLYTALLFHPTILHDRAPLMRQVVNRYFLDRVVIVLHFELVVDVSIKWAPFSAASTALQANTESGALVKKAVDLGSTLRHVSLPPGLLNVEQLGEYANSVFEANSCLRWLLLHSLDPKRGTGILTAAQLTAQNLFDEFVRLAHVEYKLRRSCLHLLNHKETSGGQLRTRILGLLDQAQRLRSDDVDAPWNSKLCTWLDTIKTHIAGLDLLDKDTPLILEHLAAKVAEVADMLDFGHKITQSHLSFIVEGLHRLQTVCLVDEDFIRALDEKRDAAFAWTLLPSWQASMEALLRRDATSVKFVFLKLSSSVDNMLFGVKENFLEKANVLSTFYHRKLELYLRKIIQTIPRTIFQQMDALHPLFPTDKAVSVEKIHLKKFADLERRRKLAKRTYEITKLSLGISSMCLANLGPIHIRPKELLYDGVRQELRQKLRNLLNEHLTSPNVFRTLANQTERISTFREAFFFVSEHIGFNGVVVWQSELETVFTDMFREEKANIKAKRPSYVTQTSTKNGPVVQQVIQTLVNQTNPRTTLFLAAEDIWLSVDQRRLEFTTDFFVAVERWLPAIANVGLRRLVAFSRHRHAQSLIKDIQASSHLFDVLPDLQWRLLKPLFETPDFVALSRRVVDLSAKIGQLLVIERCIRYCTEESVQSKVAQIRDATANLLASLKVDAANGRVLDSKIIERAGDFVALVERLGLSDHLVKPPSNVPKFAPLAFFAAVVYYLGHASNRKSEYIDYHIVLTGIVSATQTLNCSTAFEQLFALMIGEIGVLPTLRQMPSINQLLPIRNIPLALCR